MRVIGRDAANLGGQFATLISMEIVGRECFLNEIWKVCFISNKNQTTTKVPTSVQPTGNHSRILKYQTVIAE